MSVLKSEKTVYEYEMRFGTQNNDEKSKEQKNIQDRTHTLAIFIFWKVMRALFHPLVI